MMAWWSWTNFLQCLQTNTWYDSSKAELTNNFARWSQRIAQVSRELRHGRNWGWRLVSLSWWVVKGRLDWSVAECSLCLVFAEEIRMNNVQKSVKLLAFPSRVKYNNIAVEEVRRIHKSSNICLHHSPHRSRLPTMCSISTRIRFQVFGPMEHLPCNHRIF